MKQDREQLTRAWEYYERGKQYNNMLVPNQYTMVDTNLEFYAGNQWVHLPMTPAMAKLPKPTFNIVKRITNAQVANIISGGASVSLEPLAYYDGSDETDPDSTACEFAQAEINNLMNKFRMNYRLRDALFDGAITGDYCAHCYFDPDAQPYGGRLGENVKGEICMELVDGINVMFGNPNNRDVQKQPYVLLIGRDTVKHLRDEAKANGCSKQDIESIIHDSEYTHQAGYGGRVESDPDKENGKALYCYLYEKVKRRVPATDIDGNFILDEEYDKDGNPVYEEEKGKPKLDLMGQPIIKKKKRMVEKTTVHVTKATRTCEIFHDVDTGLERYPIAWGNWEKQKNQFHGRALVTGIIPNQIQVNTMMAMVLRNQQENAFPKRLYNADVIPHWNNEIGADVAVRGLAPNQAINQIATIMPPADMSNQIMQVISSTVELTKECLGSTDAQLGSAKMDNTSALMLMSTNSQTPLDNPRANLNEWVEDIVAIWLDMMGTYYAERPVIRPMTFNEPVMDKGTGLPMMGQHDGMMQTQDVTRNVIQRYDFSKLKHLYFNTRVEVGTGTPYAEAAVNQNLETLRQTGAIDMVDYLERVPDKLFPRRQELLQKIKQSQAAQASGVPAGLAVPEAGTIGSDAGVHQVLQQMNPEKMQARAAGGKTPQEMSVDAAINEMPVNVKEQFENLPARAKGEVAKIAAERMKK